MLLTPKLVSLSQWSGLKDNHPITGHVKLSENTVRWTSFHSNGYGLWINLLFISSVHRQLSLFWDYKTFYEDKRPICASYLCEDSSMMEGVNMNLASDHLHAWSIISRQLAALSMLTSHVWLNQSEFTLCITDLHHQSVNITVWV